MTLLNFDPKNIPSFDVIVTDVPYSREFLPLCGHLGRFAAAGLPRGKSCLVLCGQSYLPDVLKAMTPHLTYQWLLAYLLSGPYFVFNRRVSCRFKPILWFVNGEHKGSYGGHHFAGPYMPDLVADLVESDAPDKRFHPHGQSVSGMMRLIEQFSLPGQTICDPFVGGGSVAIAALTTGRRFVGCDIDPNAVNSTRQRIEALKGQSQRSQARDKAMALCLMTDPRVYTKKIRKKLRVTDR